MSTLNPLVIRAKLGRKKWGAPVEHGSDGWFFLSASAEPEDLGQVIVSCADWPEEPITECRYQICSSGPVEFIHASIARPQMPTYEDLVLLHKAVFPGFAYQVFAPPASHVNIHATALHLWGRLDGKPWIPDFGQGGSI